MPVYLVSIITVTDQEKFRAFRAAAPRASGDFNARQLLRGDVLDVLEGEPAEGREIVAVMELPDEAAARSMIASEAFLAARKMREGQGFVETTIRLVSDTAM